MKITTLLIASTLFIISCAKIEKAPEMPKSKNEIGIFDSLLIEKVTHKLLGKFGDEFKFRIERGVKQTADLWKNHDGNFAEFENFCLNNFVADKKQFNELFETIQKNQEILIGNFNKMSVYLQKPVQLDLGEISQIENIYAAYNPAAHISDDFFANKIAFITALNFPHYTLKEKNTLANQWKERDWAIARVGDLYNERVPANILQEFSTANSNASNYIDTYNIYMGQIRNNEGKKLFDDDLKLISHWNLRDELKSQYSEIEGLEKQQIIYNIMLHIINQTIPHGMVNSNKYIWKPINNKLYETIDNEVKNFKTEPNSRYEHLLNTFKSLIKIDKFSPNYPTYIQRKFDKEMELTFENVEQIFVELLSSDSRIQVANLIKENLGRDLEPFDIWYKGFKTSVGYSEQKLDKIIQNKFKNTNDFNAELPLILEKFGFGKEEAVKICDKIVVEASRGAGHASGAAMKDDVSRLRTRISSSGMNYKGYNIAVHEFGHNVEQTITLHDVDNYMMSGVPNTAFTEAVAFIFQSRDLEFLNMENKDPMKKYYYALDNFWSAYEIMGVALVDMYTWKWLYENPNATSEELKNAVVIIAKDVWNRYYAEVFGKRDSEILAIYSHMVAYPLYLSAYPLGHLIEFAMEMNFENKSKAQELKRILMQGRLTPKVWMEKAFDSKLSSLPLINAASDAVSYINKSKNQADK